MKSGPPTRKMPGQAARQPRDSRRGANAWKDQTVRREPPAEPRLIAFNKPYGVLCQFTADGSRPTLANFIRVPDVYPAGRLDTDSEGLLLLTNMGTWQNAIAHPTRKTAKTYWAQVEGEPDNAALARLTAPINLGDFVTAPCAAKRIDEPASLWPRNPPIRHRAAIPTAWLEITITEGKNRQIRRMTAAVGHPTLRLIRAAIGPYALSGVATGDWIEANPHHLSTTRKPSR